MTALGKVRGYPIFDRNALVADPWILTSLSRGKDVAGKG